MSFQYIYCVFSHPFNIMTAYSRLSVSYHALERTQAVKDCRTLFRATIAWYEKNIITAKNEKMRTEFPDMDESFFKWHEEYRIRAI